MSDTGESLVPHGKSGGFLDKKIGPMKASTWIVIVAGGAITFYIWKRKTAGGGNTPPLTTDNLTNPNASSLDYYSGGGGSSGTVTTPNGTAQAVTNAQWSSMAANDLIAQGDSPTDVSNALADYLNGNPLSATEQSIINVALQKYGTPPQGVLPVKQPDPGDSAGVSYKVVGGDSLTSIAQMFYGDPTKWQDIFNANKGILGSDPLGGLHHDQVLTIPGAGLLPTPGPGVSPTPIPSNHSYTVVYGDTLIQLAERFYGDANQWQKIYNANRSAIPNQNVLSPGTVLNIPA